LTLDEVDKIILDSPLNSILICV